MCKVRRGSEAARVGTGDSEVLRGFSEYAGRPFRHLRVSHYLSAYLAWRMNSLRDLGPPFLGGSVVVFRSFIGCRAPVIWEVHANRAFARWWGPHLNTGRGLLSLSAGCNGLPCSRVDLHLPLGLFWPWCSAASRGRLRSGSLHVLVSTRVPPWSSETWSRAGNPPSAYRSTSNTGL